MDKQKARQETKQEDGSLVERLRQRDGTAMEILYDRYASLIYTVSLRVVRDHAQAEDVLQEIFLQLWRRPESFDARKGSLGSWLATVARNRSIDCLRRMHPLDLLEDGVVVPGYNPEREAEQRLMLMRAHTLIEQLPIKQQTMVRMAFVEGMTHPEIAEKTGKPLGTIKKRIRTGLLSMRSATGYTAA